MGFEPTTFCMASRAGMEKDLVEMSYDKRAAKLAQVKRETMGREYSEPEEPLPPEDEEENG
jgi:hypothetical protein